MTTPFSVSDILTPFSPTSASTLHDSSAGRVCAPTLELLDCPTGGYGPRYPPAPSYGHHDMTYDARNAAAAHATYGHAASHAAAASWYPGASGTTHFACEFIVCVKHVI